MNIEAFFRLTYGLYIVSSGKEGNYNGYIANTAFQVTAEPPQIAIACNRDNHTAKFIEETGYFSISVLQQESRPDIIGLFGYQSGRDVNKFEKIKYISGESGVPIVTEDCIAWFECKLLNKMDVGSHTIYVGEILNNDLLEESLEPLTYAYYRNVKKGKAPKNAPTYQKADEKKEIKSGPAKYQCIVCGHIYDPEEGDPESGIAPGTAFDDLPDDWVCPVCGAEKRDFEEI